MIRRVTLKDDAAASGSAVSTVSAILNNRPDNWASAETRKRVMETAARLGFRPNRMARSLRGKCHDLVLASIPRATNPCYAELASAIRRHLGKEGIDLGVEETGFLRENDEHLVNTLPTRHIDGAILITSAGMESIENFSRAVASIPVVLLGTGLASTQCDRFHVDMDDGLRQALIHLRVLGHSGVGIMDSTSGYVDPAERFNHMSKLLGDVGMHTRPEWHIHSKDDLDSIRESVRVWAAAKRGKDLPGALVCTNDITAIASIRGLAEAGMRVPEDISVIGFDGIQIANMLPRRLTTIAQPLGEMAERAVHHLLGRIRGKITTPPVSILLPSRLRIGETTGPAPTS